MQLKKTKQYLDFVNQKNDDHIDFIKTHAKVITNFSSITNAIRLFNIEMETVKMLDVGTLPELVESELKLEPDNCKQTQCETEPEPLPLAKIENDTDEDINIKYTFPPSDLSSCKFVTFFRS